MSADAGSARPPEGGESPDTAGDAEHDRLRALATRVVEAIGGNTAVRTLFATLEVYDRAGGGLMAGGLAYSALIALVPGMLLVASAIGLLVTDPEVQDRIVQAIAEAVPPLEDVVEAALETVAAGAVPTSIIALVGLLWGSSRFYAALDYAFSKVFHGDRTRNEIVRTLRGLLVTILFIALPIVVLIVGSLASWLLDLAPEREQVDGVARTIVQVATPAGSFVLFVFLVALVYRFVPPERVPARALVPPALLVGFTIAAFTQLFTFVGPRLASAALYGAFVAVFALLAWLSIGFNMLMLGAAWTRVRAVALAQPGAAPAPDVEDAAAT